MKIVQAIETLRRSCHYCMMTGDTLAVCEGPRMGMRLDKLPHHDVLVVRAETCSVLCFSLSVLTAWTQARKWLPPSKRSEQIEMEAPYSLVGTSHAL